MTKVQARDEDNNPVDWWFIYKVPKLTKSADSDSATGYEYVYFDPNAKAVQRSPNLLNGGKGALNLTLKSVFSGPAPSTGWILYNDEKPLQAGGSDDGNCGHSKGVMAFDTTTKTAFWLLHSWPKYVAPDATAAPTPMYGQTYMCISLTLDTANKIAELMVTHQEPQCFLPRETDKSGGTGLSALTKPLLPKNAPAADVLDCTSAGGMPFKVLAKNREWNQDFWNGFVGPKLQADMDVETWIRGTIPPVADTDGIHKTFDVKYITLGPLGLHFAWPETHDHAKWGITKQQDWICVGDINRMISQRKRGGGTIAFQNKILWQALSKTDLILAPPGHTRAEAHALIQQTHINPDTPATRRPPPQKGQAHK
jgi:deoxyribonuclease-2